MQELKLADMGPGPLATLQQAVARGAVRLNVAAWVRTVSGSGRYQLVLDWTDEQGPVRWPVDGARVAGPGTSLLSAELSLPAGRRPSAVAVTLCHEGGVRFVVEELFVQPAPAKGATAPERERLISV